MKRLVAILFPLLLGSATAHAALPSATVRGFFAALGEQDFVRALAFTDGAAATKIGRLLGTIRREAAKKHAVVELEVRSLAVTEGTPDEAGQVPVEVRYDVAIFGKRWWLRWLARSLTGTASFVVDGQNPRIVAIVGQIGQ